MVLGHTCCDALMGYFKKKRERNELFVVQARALAREAMVAARVEARAAAGLVVETAAEETAAAMTVGAMV